MERLNIRNSGETLLKSILQPVHINPLKYIISVVDRLKNVI